MLTALKNTISIFDEIVAYETLWAIKNQSLKSLATLFKETKLLPSQLLNQKSDFFEIPKLQTAVTNFLLDKQGFSVCVKGDFQYPERLQDAKYPIQLFYYKGDLGLLDSPCISVVGTRKCSEDGIKRTEKLVNQLVSRGYTVVSGLALGIDTVAMTTAIKTNGNTVGVIGTPIDRYYPKQNKTLQDKIAKNHLLISQVPFYRYKKEHIKAQRIYFPQRNTTMSALSKATIIVEASDTSGTLTQARACIEQGRKLFILDSCFKNPDIKWPKTYEKKGAIRVREVEDVIKSLQKDEITK